MYDVVDFCHMLAERNPEPPVDFLQVLKDKGRVPSGVETIEELDPIQEQWLLQE